MDKLWAPWRVKYIRAINKKTKGCLFCNIYRERKDKKNYIFIRSKHFFSVLNIYPYNNGHSLIVPNRHVSDISKLNDGEKLDLFGLLDSTRLLLNRTLNPKGYNIGMNLGRVAGAGFPGHVHIHIVPRWDGDTNFMPVLGNTKVVSQSLSDLWGKLNKCKRAKK